MSVVFIALLGMANSLIWPSVWPLGMLGKDPRTHASRQYGKSIIDFEIHKMAAVIQEELKH